MTISTTGNALLGFNKNIFDSIFTLATFTASAESADYPKENLRNWSPGSVFQSPGTGSPNATEIVAQASGAFTINCIGLGAHNLTDVCTKIVVSQVGGSQFRILLPADFENNRPMFTDFTVFDAQTGGVKIRFEHTGTLKLGLLYVGQKTQLYYPQLVNQSGVIYRHGTAGNTNIAQSGAWLGRSVIPKPRAFKLSQPGVPISWARSTWLDFMEHAEAKPFFYIWDEVNFPTHAALCMARIPMAAPIELSGDLARCSMQIDVLPH